MSKWKTASLKNITTLMIDGDWVESKDQSAEGIRLIQTGNIGEGEYLDKFKNAKYISDEAFVRLNCTEVFENDVLISRLPTPVGRACIIPQSSTRMITAVDCTIMRFNNAQCIPGYFVYFSMSPNYLNQVTKHLAGSTRVRISRKNLETVIIPLPPIETQKQITKTLDTAADLLAMRKQQLAELDNLIKSTFYDMFGDPVSNSVGQNLVKLQSLIKNKNDLVDGPFGSSVNTKVDYVIDGEIPVIRTKNVNNLEFITEDLKFMTREKYETVIRSQVLPNDIILTKVGTIGNLCIFPNTYLEGVLSTTGSCRIRANKELVNTKFLLYYLHFYKPKMLEIASAGVQAFLNMNHIKDFDIFDVEIELQNQFATIVFKIEEQKALVKKAINETQYLFDSLMSEYF